jgi:hypothetical protein
MSSNRIRFRRTIFTAPLTDLNPDQLIEQLAAEDIELVIDMRGSYELANTTDLDALCANAEIYYERRQGLAEQTDADVAWAARLALRHSTCLLGESNTTRLLAARAVADLVGMRVIDLEASPAPITDPSFRARSAH